MFLPARSKAGLGAGFRIHDLRHTAASQFPGWLSAEDGPGDPGACHTTTLDLYGTSTLATWTATPIVSTAPPTRLVRPKQGQMTVRTSRPQSDQGVYLRNQWRARRDSNPQPSDP